ncbi:TPA: glutamate--tRNA ligase, partial [Candidatus Woesearchaeota archaeon]|nr:glutamate--tRNA ligase [Candidatus Woesearchaeota archaeon]
SMKTLPEGHAVLRLKIDLKHKNTTMRDPTIFRVIDAEHARTGKKYRVWPNYDWQNSLLDGHLGVTHRIRGKEFELRTELQHYIQNMFGFRPTQTFEAGRFNLEGVESSGRIIREKIEKGELLGWDDPEITTIAALRRRGFQPEALISFTLSTGFNKSESTLTWDDLIMHNKRLLDENADRFFFIRDPIAVTIKGAPSQDVELNLHPTHRKGGRKMHCGELFYLAKSDFDSMKPGKLYRLMGYFNFRMTEDGFVFVSTDMDAYKKEGAGMFHWLPQSKDLVETEVLLPDKELVTGVAEEGIRHLKENSVIQFERFGFCRLDDKTGDNKCVFWFTHK